MLAGHPELSALKIEVEALAERHRWAEVHDRLASYGEVDLYTEPKLAYAMAAARLHLGAPDRALPLALATEGEFRRRRDNRNLLRALNLVGAVLFELGDLEGAEERFSSLLELASDSGDEEMQARATNNLGMIASLRGEHPKALSLYRLSIPAYQKRGQRRGLAQTYHNMAILYRDRGLLREADAYDRRAAEMARRIGDARLAAMAVVGRAEIAYLRGDLEAAAAAAARALRDLVAQGDALGQADALRLLGMVARAQGDLEEGRDRLEAALEIARSNANPLLEAETLRERGLLHRESGRADLAEADLRAAAALFARIGARAEEKRTKELLASS
ncbi:MAG: tetratricopeptide repeat protein [Gemmatimonadetes bacterium]|nr:tetratricopeptide repeat protein [Gemmatimonadota bacterium]